MYNFIGACVTFWGGGHDQNHQTTIQGLGVCGWVEAGDEFQFVEQSRNLAELYWGEITISVTCNTQTFIIHIQPIHDTQAQFVTILYITAIKNVI